MRPIIIRAKPHPLPLPALLLLGFLTTGAAFAGPASAIPQISPEWDIGKELHLGLKVHLDTPKGIGSFSAKLKLSLNYEETGVISMGGTKVTLKPTKASGSPQMSFEIYNDEGTVVYQSTVPFEGDIDLSAKLDPAETGFFKADISVWRHP